ncbi:MAG: S24 family peptidase [Sphaerochaetaceae bacterium]|jgi:DNA polymerase V|nr:S24 family peptidase [Sphaerochaetaceae bacterium]MDD3162709.1 S24 family peptidase [Sphaerochaetaceae bacterium]MDD4007050.1 S24 family peptidase [Sphaerochaetaceae bacterium]MDD4396684.1 S24 family peptidase [Sphaerochaetaceae bacterium]
MDTQIIGSIVCGFPSPGIENREDPLDFNDLLVRHPSSTYCLRASGDSMEPLIMPGDVLVTDRSLRPRDGDIIVAEVDGLFTAKRVCIHGECPSLVAENPSYSRIPVTGELVSFGVVTAIVRQLR